MKGIQSSLKFPSSSFEPFFHGAFWLVLQHDAEIVLNYLETHTDIGDRVFWEELEHDKKVALCRKIEIRRETETRMLTHTPRRSQLVVFVQGGGKVFSDGGIEPKPQVLNQSLAILLSTVFCFV